jgi:hypothetical protein
MLFLTGKMMYQQRKKRYNTDLEKVAVQFSEDSFVVAENLALRINICGKNRQLLEASKCYALHDNMKIK